MLKFASFNLNNILTYLYYNYYNTIDKNPVRIKISSYFPGLNYVVYHLHSFYYVYFFETLYWCLYNCMEFTKYFWSSVILQFDDLWHICTNCTRNMFTLSCYLPILIFDHELTKNKLQTNLITEEPEDLAVPRLFSKKQ